MKILDLLLSKKRQSNRSRKHRRPSKLRGESLENREMMTSGVGDALGMLNAGEPMDLEHLLTVDSANPNCGDPFDGVYCEIQDAIDAAHAGDHVVVYEGEGGGYEPFTVNRDGLTVRADAAADPLISAAGEANGVQITANNVTVKGLHVVGARRGFFVTGDTAL